jgi:hypothetical protein
MSYCDAALVDKLTAEAQPYYENYDEEQLLELLAEEWARVAERGMPVRSDDNTGVRIARRLMKDLASEPEMVSATIATIGTQVLEHMEFAGYNLDTYEIPITILIAYLVKAILAEWKESKSKKGETNDKD